MEKSKMIKRVLILCMSFIIILAGMPIKAQAATQHSTLTGDISFKVNGKDVDVQTYYIMLDGSVVVKVRDIANALKNTDKKFSVTVDTKKKTLTIKPGKSYTAVGGENKLTTKDYLGTKTFTLYENSTKQSEKVYTINKDYYIAMSSLAILVDYSMKYNDSTYKCTINTEYGYGKEPAAPVVVTDTANTVTDATGLIKEPFPDAALIKNPSTVSDFDRIIKYMFVNSIMSYTVETDESYDEVNDGDTYSNALAARGEYFYTAENHSYPEIYYGTMRGTSITIKGTEKGCAITIKFVGFCSENKATLEKKNKEYLDKTQAAVKSLIDSGKITSTMTELEKAKAIYFWVYENVEYSSLSTKNKNATGYSAIVDKEANCSGNTALYNLMCRYAGLSEVYGMIGKDKITGIAHMWTVQILDGTKVFTDATWKISYSYFAQSEKTFAKDHTWNTKNYPDWNNAPGLVTRLQELIDTEYAKQLEEDESDY